jgi:hypothetical protein
MEAPIRSGKWSNFCHQLAHAPAEEFSNNIPSAMKTLNAKVASLFVEWNQSSVCKEELNHLLDRLTQLNLPQCADQKIKLLRTLFALKDGTDNLETEAFRIRIQQYEIKKGKEFLERSAEKLFTDILENLAASGPLLTHHPECRAKLRAIMDAFCDAMPDKDQRRYGPILRVFARRMEQLVPGSVSEKCKAYDERKVEFLINGKIIRATSSVLRALAKSCEYFKDLELRSAQTTVEFQLPANLHVAAFKELLRWYETEREGGKIPYQRAFNLDDSFRVAIALGDANRLKVLLSSYSRTCSVMYMLHNSENMAALGFKNFQELIKIAARFPHPLIEEVLKKDKEFLIGNIPNYLRSPNFWNLARHDLPSDIVRAIISKIEDLVKHAESNPMSLGADPIIPVVKSWLKLVRQEKLPHNYEVLSWAIENVLLAPFSQEPIPQMMDKFRKAFPEFIAQYNKKVDLVEVADDQGALGEFGEITKKQDESPAFKIDLSASKKPISFEVLETLIGWNISELKFHEKTPEVEKLMLLMPMTKFEFVVPPPPPSAAGEFFKRIITGF